VIFRSGSSENLSSARWEEGRDNDIVETFERTGRA